MLVKFRRRSLARRWAPASPTRSSTPPSGCCSCVARGCRSVADALSYSVHSFRIYLACALLAAGCPRWLIMRMLRWRGEESLDIYARVSDHQWEEQLAGALGAQVDASLVPRLPRMDL